MNDELTDSQVKEVLKALDEALEKGPWEATNFLRVIGKNLQEIRENLVTEIAKVASNQNAALESSHSRRTPKTQDEQEIFVSLYTSDGSVLQSWEKIIANLPRQVITRPIYSNEQHVQALIKSKENKVNEAYVSVFVQSSDILSLPTEKIAIDKFGNAMMVLKDRALDLNNINRFVHLSGTYRYSKGRLVMV